MTNSSYTERRTLHELHTGDEAALLDALMERYPFSADERTAAASDAADLVRRIRADDAPGLMEVFLAEYGLSTEEGIALMCLAEALLRVPDAETMDALIEDKIAPSHWGAHLGKSSSPLVNASTWALMLTGKVLQDGRGLAHVLQDAVRRLGEPVIRTAVGRAMRELGAQFVLGETIEEAVKRGRKSVERGYTYSYDMLGEAARTEADAAAYDAAYHDAIRRLAQQVKGTVRDAPGISIKLSALHPRYEERQRTRVMDELVPRARALALAAREAGMGLNIDAEEADRLELSMDVIEAVLEDPALAGWDGFGIVVQAYGKRAEAVIDWFHALAERLDRKVMLRLVKGAYWDTEIKRAQVEGLKSFPVWTRKAATDVAYLSLAKKLLGMTDRIYPQFATHNAHSVAAILKVSGDRTAFEFQRLHGMGGSLHDLVMKDADTRCRIYAPVGAHRDLLAYLVRRLLENGANSSFVNQIVDEDVPPEVVAADPFEALAGSGSNRAVVPPGDLYLPERPNSIGWDLADRADFGEIDEARLPFRTTMFEAGPLMAAVARNGEDREVLDPATGAVVGRVHDASDHDVNAALNAAAPWTATARERADVLNRAADLYESRFGEAFALLAREAGKTPDDAVAELREAVDFLRYYAARGQESDAPARGIFTCISPWNFPLAIFTGQVAGALAAGNGVLAKPAESTVLTAAWAVRILHEAGVPREVLQLVPGDGTIVGRKLTSDARVAGVAFTGSTDTAQAINRAMAGKLEPTAPLIAETGGLNAMIVDSTALPEQAVRDLVLSAFRSAGQRCSACRILYVQSDVADAVLEMLEGAMAELTLGDPWDLSTDVGPVIDEAARADIQAHVDKARAEGRLVRQLDVPANGHFVGPALILVKGIADMEREVFGPVLHVATFEADDLDRVIDAINDRGFGLTFGIHSRIDDRVDQVARRLKVGNIYVNRNQIGAIVGSQPFGGEGLSGTGPKAGGPSYVARFTRPGRRKATAGQGRAADVAEVTRAIRAAGRPGDTPTSSLSLPGPTGESNRLSTYGRGVILCLGPTAGLAEEQARLVRGAGSVPVIVAPGAESKGSIDGVLARDALSELQGIDGVALWSDADDLRAARIALAARNGPILPLLAEDDIEDRAVLERHVCVDTTAAGGNARLLAQSA
ncbi:bifunctional proline dehydrogenase/L-glutamate gamma-semialdehyde dehydrogenase PutA [Ovoidimarina sediminis]|uniref:bifunctional proline dehydrogenase/L-glutamate gamma-semialdehyde dehydrogenase PutA n=1 Tax=Ovoidimarina sediminis TaxID=3079856 RepID=UPI00290F2864|nr:bifunctional proline dehydrogenase/L-glutamate gamma-semialdehyde dehydrogenase PutA [Rhodophyticola sp. MJ-SS7]MDU8944811.1 bifunctional proline dehydrogenase/L-glutamate gamma-semialdehyde dehydrogenase PutA [Rhodophyticola sp. MJ-SS7]